MSGREIKHKYKPWINKGIIISTKRRNELFGKYIRSKIESRKATVYDKYKILRNKINEVIRKSNFFLFKKYFQKNTKNIKNLWQGINQIVYNKSKPNACPTYINNQRYSGDGNFEKYLNNSIATEPVNCRDISRIISSFKIKKIYRPL